MSKIVLEERYGSLPRNEEARRGDILSRKRSRGGDGYLCDR